MPILEDLREKDYPQYCSECGLELNIKIIKKDGWEWKFLRCPKYRDPIWLVPNHHDSRLIDYYREPRNFDPMTGERIRERSK